MKQFYRKVDLRNRQAMTDFLKGHFRYNTMNSWNRSTSYANNIKAHNLGLDNEVQDKLLELIETPEYGIERRWLFNKFAERYNYAWQIGVNGRSGGYLVLYRGYIEPSEHKSYCTVCGQRNFTSVSENSNICGKCGEPARIDYVKPPTNIGIYPGRSTDMHEDFEDFTLGELKERVRLVQEFDRVVDNLLTVALRMLADYEIEDEIYFVPKTRKVLKEVRA